MKLITITLLVLSASFTLVACAKEKDSPTTPETKDVLEEIIAIEEQKGEMEKTEEGNKKQKEEEMKAQKISENAAKVTKVSVSGSEKAYNFSVTIKSPDTGCDQYANWWEVVKPDGTLVYRRILGHSHVGEQPFTRSGGSVAITKDEVVYVLAHMNNLGYDKMVMKGSVKNGFTSSTIPDTLDISKLTSTSPLPSRCAF